ncbi:DUF4386 family protein [Microlunatus speluncae]|uniref:DUF4386 family protein n=1 Tax=Microlunatus speluncae TaxID=2594267 RepID=UPI00126678E9|nr:DUF4386 family protein [Microlunatus speluncae]
MSTSTASPARTTNPVGASCGAAFAVLFLLSDTITRPLQQAPATLPTDPPAAMLTYYLQSGTAITAHAAFHAVSALLLIGFVLTVGQVLARVAPARATLRLVAVAGGIGAAVALIISAGVNVYATLSATGLSEGAAQALRLTNFYTGGTIHVALLGVFAVASCLIALRARPWARGFSWFGLVSGVLSILSLLSLAIYYATPLIPLGRFSHFAWAICICVVLLIKRRR